MQRVTMLLGCCALLLAAPAMADGAGGPVPPQQAGAGASTPQTDLSYIAVPAGDKTVVERLRRADGVVERTRLLAGRWGVPGVAYDGSSTGLSADGATLVLADATAVYPIKNTRLLVLRARSLRPRTRIVLPGWYAVDAISPDGRWMYLIHYTSVSNTNRYEVRAYDLRNRRMVAKPVIDPREPDEKMQGIPVTRVMSADGRWAYTLYMRPDEAPFIHALDTQGRTAACIDLDDVTSDDIADGRLALSGDGATLRVNGEAGPLALVDTKTFAVRKPTAAPAPRPPAPAPARRQANSGGGVPWEAALLALIPLGGLAVVARRRTVRRGAPR
ncbi:MAG TPA: hypothetical protein VH834_22065 [Solirubrobacteraceae bacterium]|jgi:hypothetical protein